MTQQLTAIVPLGLCQCFISYRFPAPLLLLCSAMSRQKGWKLFRKRNLSFLLFAYPIVLFTVQCQSSCAAQGQTMSAAKAVRREDVDLTDSIIAAARNQIGTPLMKLQQALSLQKTRALKLKPIRSSWCMIQSLVQLVFGLQKAGEIWKHTANLQPYIL